MAEPAERGTPVAPEAPVDDAVRVRVRVPAGRVAAVATRPRFVVGHVVVVALAVTTIWLGRWQWHAAHVHHGSVQNYAYAFQWWIFCAFGIAMWIRIMRDRAARELETGRALPSAAERRAAATQAAADLPAGYRPYVMPDSAQLARDQGRDRYRRDA